MSLLKVSALTCSGFILWLAPPFTLSRKIPLHNLTTGLALIGSFACCFEARRVALKLSQVQDFEAMKQRAINADVEDEIATEIYISQQQRRMEAEAILNAGSERSEEVERLERSLALIYGDSEPAERSEQSQLTEAERKLAERILQLKTRGYGKAKIILEIWGVSKGGSPKYKAAEAEYKPLVGE